MYKNRKVLYSFTMISMSLLFFSVTFDIFGENEKVFEAQIIFEKPADFTKYRDNLHAEVFDLKQLTNNNDLCPSGNCKFEFIDDDYINGLRYQNNEQLSLTGTLEVNNISNNNKSNIDITTTTTANPSNLYGLHGFFQVLNGIPPTNNENDELINEPKRIEGTLNIGKKVFSAPEFEYDINGELKERNNDIVLNISAFQ
jgi:hypothetical protein